MARAKKAKRKVRVASSRSLVWMAGFTLIEVLVVIAIIAVLAAILFPVFSRAREKARQAVCHSNLRQMGLAIRMYIQDFEAYPPQHAKCPMPDGRILHIRWWNAIQPYQRNFQIFVCPSVPHWEPGRNMSYGYNYQYLGNARPPDKGGYMPVYDAQIEVPSQTILIADSDGTGRLPYDPDSKDPHRIGNHGYTIDPPFLPPRPGNYWCISEPGFKCWISKRHNGGANVAFCDGHVKWYRREALYQDNSLWNGRGDPRP